MKHHILMPLSLGLVLSLFIPNGHCKFNSFQEIDLGDDYVQDDDIDLVDQEYSENTVDDRYKYSFNVIDEEEQVYQSQRQEREKGVGSRICQNTKVNDPNVNLCQVRLKH